MSDKPTIMVFVRDDLSADKRVIYASKAAAFGVSESDHRIFEGIDYGVVVFSVSDADHLLKAFIDVGHTHKLRPCVMCCDSTDAGKINAALGTCPVSEEVLEDFKQRYKVLI